MRRGTKALARLCVAAALALGGRPAPLAAAPTDEAPGVAAGDPDYVAGRQAIERQQWREAIRLLEAAARRDNRNPDIHNYLGFAYRHAGDFAQAFAHYDEALRLDPRHRGAHEYAGEASLLVNDLPKAEEHLAALERICLLPCEELDDLRKAVAAYRTRAAPGHAEAR
jgi:Flp pilus assembly protein TadD